MSYAYTSSALQHFNNIFIKKYVGNFVVNVGEKDSYYTTTSIVPFKDERSVPENYHYQN